MSTINFTKKNVKRKSAFSNTNRIRLDLFTFEKNEIDEKKQKGNNCFSFSSNLIKGNNQEEEKQNQIKKEENKLIIKQFSIKSGKTTNDSDESKSEDSSDISCDEE
jgi:hypothetical protein